MTEFDRFKYEISNCETPTLFHPLLPRLFCSVSWEFSASGCLSVSEFPIAAHEAEQDRKQAGGGSFFFGYFLLAKQKKVTRVSRESDLLQSIPVYFSTNKLALITTIKNGFPPARE